jgi:hypothetical protein
MSSVFLRKELDAPDLGEIMVPPVCDFCGLNAPQYVYAAPRTSTQQAIRCWRWCACPECVEHVESENFTPLILQITEMLLRRSKSMEAQRGEVSLNPAASAQVGRTLMTADERLALFSRKSSGLRSLFAPSRLIE